MPRSIPKTRSAKAIQDYCRSQRLTQKQFAEILGVDTVTLSRYERSVSPVGITWVADEIERLTGVAPPRTREELSEQLEAWPLDRLGPGASRDGLADALEEERPPGSEGPRRRRRGRGHE